MTFSVGSVRMLQGGSGRAIRSNRTSARLGAAVRAKAREVSKSEMTRTKDYDRSYRDAWVE
jgi:hypothetical protein